MRQIAIMLALVAAATASAQNFKPGLWELNNKIQTGDPQRDEALAAMATQLKNMPPEQRARLEGMMSKNGISLPTAGADGGIVSTACLTPEMAARKELPISQNGKCSSTQTPVAGGLDVTFSCSEPKSSGSGQIRFVDENHYTMNATVNADAGGQGQTVKVNTRARWLGASCPARPK
ncbi:DUF3617 domain-containing protein [Duganella callida]|uniref:DUF3617 domain-containing protein n=1 Tax=Duganella callida TaxID=2561932 RepID=A0A4Y9T220_9BURK|nr:DUF3617 domain-containing protein [Duganella callida]TFW30957.1 DUF3617 domain-containing protein [Duganella callida]